MGSTGVFKYALEVFKYALVVFLNVLYQYI